MKALLTKIANVGIAYPTESPENFDDIPERYYKNGYAKQRRAALMTLSSVFKQHDKFLKLNIDDRFELLDKIEEACLSYTNAEASECNFMASFESDIYSLAYILAYGKIAENIDQENNVKNTYLFNAIIDGSIDITILPRLKASELFPDKYRDIINKLEMSKNIQVAVKTSKLYTCSRCKNKECTYENLYNRSLDEGVNLTVLCIACGFSWKA